MRFAIQDYHSIFDLNEIMNHIAYQEGCMRWKGSHKGLVAIRIIRYDGQLISCSVLDILSAILADRFVNRTNRKCKYKYCINPMHYL